MRTSGLPLLPLAVFLTSALAVAAGCASQPDPPPAAPPPYGPQAGMYPPPPQGYAQGPWSSGPYSYPAASSPRSPYEPQVRALPPNLVALSALRNAPCAPEEVAPGVWVSFDCSAPDPVRRAVSFVPRWSLAAGPLPVYVDHRIDGTEGPVKDQGAVGACTAFSLSTAMENAIRRVGRRDVLSALHIWSKYGVPQMGVAGDQNVEERITVEPVWPYDAVKACKLMRQPLDSCGSAYGVASGTGYFDPRLRAEQKAADAGGRYSLIGVEALRTSPPDVREIASVLAAGDDIWASFHVDTAAWKHRSLNSGVIPDYNRRGSTGHAVVLAGYRVVGLSRQFLVHNSWSEKWGDRGYAWISEAMVLKHLRSAYRVRVTEASSGPLPAPPPAPSPTPTPPAPSPSGSCPTGQGKDIVYGSCASLCPSGAPPAAGVCVPAVPGLSLPMPPINPRPLDPAACPQGQAKDLMTGQCMGLCPGGAPAVGGFCIPVIR